MGRNCGGCQAGGLADWLDWLTGWLAGLLVSSCPWLSGREASRSTKAGQGRAWKGGVGVSICLRGAGETGETGDTSDTRPQIWPDPDLTAMPGHAKPDQKGEAKHGRMFRSRILRRDQRLCVSGTRGGRHRRAGLLLCSQSYIHCTLPPG